MIRFLCYFLPLQYTLIDQYPESYGLITAV